jgi:hypothetical protein
MALRRAALYCLPLLLVTAWSGARASAPGAALPEAPAADADEPIVTTENILASERFWPYRVALTKPWRPPGPGGQLAPGLAGVLIRVEASTRARIDFGRDGVHELPTGATDLIERANRIRRGELEKEAPNFVWAIGARLLDSASPALAPVSLRRVAEHRVFLCVFADPAAADFAELARALGALGEREGLATLYFPQGEHPDSEVFARLRALGWTVPFVHDHLAESYTRSLLTRQSGLPALLLQTDEGRLLLERGWSAESPAELARELARSEALGALGASGDPTSGSPQLRH